MEQLELEMVQMEQVREEMMAVNLAPETIDVLVTLMARAMVVVVRSAKEENNEG